MKTYDLSPRTSQTLDRAFFQMPFTDDQQQRIEAINEKLRQTATFLAKMTSECPEQTLMVRAIQEAGFWAREAIHKNESGGK